MTHVWISLLGNDYFGNCALTSAQAATKLTAAYDSIKAAAIAAGNTGAISYVLTSYCNPTGTDTCVPGYDVSKIQVRCEEARARRGVNGAPVKPRRHRRAPPPVKHYAHPLRLDAPCATVHHCATPPRRAPPQAAMTTVAAAQSDVTFVDIGTACGGSNQVYVAPPPMMTSLPFCW